MPDGHTNALAFVPQYRYDLFISYAQADEAAPTNWVSRFRDVLARELEARLGRPSAIWFDVERLKPGFNISEKIRYDLERTAVMLRIVSPSYNNSGYCSLERDWFNTPLQKPLDPLEIDSQSRNILCVLRPDPESAPDPATILTRLHDENGTPLPLEPLDKLQSAVTSLASAIEKLLRRMSDTRKALYLPYAGPDIEESRKRLISDLHAEGYRTIPRPNDPFQKAKTMEELNQTPLAVFLLGSSFLSDHKNRLEVARTLNRPVIVWIDPDAEDMQQAQVEFADSLITQPPGELMRNGSVQDLMQTVRKRLKEGIPASIADRVNAKRQAGGARKVLLISKPEDRTCADELRAEVEKAGLTVLLPDFSLAGGVAEQRVDALAKWSEASGVLVLAKAFAPTWFDQQLRKLSRPSATRMADAVALLVPPPKPEMKQSAENNGFQIDKPARLLVLANEKVVTQQLEPFLRQLLQDTGSAP